MAKRTHIQDSGANKINKKQKEQKKSFIAIEGKKSKKQNTLLQGKSTRYRKVSPELKHIRRTSRINRQITQKRQNSVTVRQKKSDKVKAATDKH